MSKFPLLVLMSLGMASGVYAQSTSGGVTMSTDPAKAAAVEKHAQELKAHPAQEMQAKPATAHSSTHHAKHQAKQQHASAKPAPKS